MKKMLLALFLIFISLSAQAADHWYRIELTQCTGTGNTGFSGSSKLSAAELQEALIKEPFIKLSNLFYVDKNKFKKWSEWEEEIIPEVTIRTSTVRSFMEYKNVSFEK